MTPSDREGKAHEGTADALAKAIDCKHLKGTWIRQGRFSALVCDNKDYMMAIDVDSDGAFNLFEGGESAIQLFGPELKPVPGDDIEAYQVNFLDKGFNPKAVLESLSAQTRTEGALQRLREKVEARMAIFDSYIQLKESEGYVYGALQGVCQYQIEQISTLKWFLALIDDASKGETG